MPSFINLDSTFGAAYIGAMVTLMLYGLTSLQSYLYFFYYPKDDRTIKFTVALVWLLDTLHVALVCYTMYYYLVTNYANPLALLHGIWSLDLSVLINTFVACIVQAFFTQRVYQLTPQPWKYPVTFIVAATVVVHFALGIDTVVKFFQIGEFSRLSEVTYDVALPFAIFSVLSDIAVAAALCILLQNSRTEYHSTNSILYRLIIFAINRCILTSVVAIAELIVFVRHPQSLWFLAMDFVIGKLYANSLLATLNTRRAISGRGLSDTRGAGMISTSTSLRIGSGGTTDSSGPGDSAEAEPIIDLAVLGSDKTSRGLSSHHHTHRTAAIDVRTSRADD